MAPADYLDVQPSAQKSSLQAVADHLFPLMLRNLATDDFVFVDPGSSGRTSAPGCVLASPTYPYPPVPEGQGGPQDYLFNWTRDAAIAAMELGAPSAPLSPAQRAQRLGDYISFAQTCQAHPASDGHWDDFARACFTIEGTPRKWGNQSDGPALQTLALLQAFTLVDSSSQAMALELIAANIQFLLKAYDQPTVSLWEEEHGNSFFARCVQLRCFQAVARNAISFAVPPGVDDAITWLQAALPRHWSADQACYLTFEPPWTPEPTNHHDPYDPNIDIMLAALYGTIPASGGVDHFLDPKLLASAAAVRAVWTESGLHYPINTTDAGLELGPVLGRYPSDYYDGNTNDPELPGHPWALCTSAFAELYYRTATAIAATNAVPSDPLATTFLAQVGVSSVSAVSQVESALCSAADRMLRSVIFHSDNLELGEQFDRDSGFERSLANLTWSYASFLSAVRAQSKAGPPSP
jgi:glucoamylase